MLFNLQLSTGKANGVKRKKNIWPSATGRSSRKEPEKDTHDRWLAPWILLACIGIAFVAANAEEMYRNGRIAISTATYKGDANMTATIASDAELSPASEIVDLSPPRELYCTWNASQGGGEDCRARLTSHICSNNKGKDNIATQKAGSRVLLFGDSTFYRMEGFVRQRLVSPRSLHLCHGTHDIKCNWKVARRCKGQVFYGLPSGLQQGGRVQPKVGQEGPSGFGLQNPGCEDCSGCNAVLLFCTSSEMAQPCQLPPQQYTYQGGYLNIEFARDVTLQTQAFNTSQENVAYFLHHSYNSPFLVETFGKPYCFVNTVFHDMMIQNMTKEVFVENVKWYLQLLQPECHRIVWVSSTAPLGLSKFIQKVENTFEWNQAIQEMLRTTVFNGECIPYIDVYNASIGFGHAAANDNIHMHGSWYKALGSFIGDLIMGCGDVGVPMRTSHEKS